MFSNQSVSPAAAWSRVALIAWVAFIAACASPAMAFSQARSGSGE